MNLPELTDDTVIELAREGGVAFIPKLTGLRRITLSSLTSEQRRQVVAILQQSLPFGFPPGQSDSPGRGDQRYYRIQIFWTQHSQAQYTDIILLIPEQDAPASLVDLWQTGGNCACD